MLLPFSPVPHTDHTLMVFSLRQGCNSTLLLLGPFYPSAGTPDTEELQAPGAAAHRTGHNTAPSAGTLQM